MTCGTRVTINGFGKLRRRRVSFAKVFVITCGYHLMFSKREGTLVFGLVSDVCKRRFQTCSKRITTGLSLPRWLSAEMWTVLLIKSRDSRPSVWRTVTLAVTLKIQTQYLPFDGIYTTSILSCPRRYYQASSNPRTTKDETNEWTYIFCRERSWDLETMKYTTLNLNSTCFVRFQYFEESLDTSSKVENGTSRWTFRPFWRLLPRSAE